MPVEGHESRKGKVMVDGEQATITFRRILHHPPELVWEAITDPVELKGWLMCSFAKIEARTGGSIEMVSGPAQYHVKGKILVWDPPKVYEHEWKVDPVAEMPHGEDAIFRYELTREGDATLLTVTYRRLSRRTAGGFAPGAHALLDRLAAQLDHQPLPDWMSRFKEHLIYYPEWSEKTKTKT
jgi:uncharacterized protein YndB with AHSA1/START domain